MKIIQTDNQLEIQKGANTQIFLGGFFVLAGIILVVLLFMGILKINGGSPPWWMWLISIGFIVAGGAFVFFASKTRVIFQLGGETQIEKTRLIGGKTTHESFPTASITALQLETRLEQSTTTTNNSSNGRNEYRYERKSDLYVQLNDGRRIILDSSSRPISNIGSVGGSFSIGVGGGGDTTIPLAEEGNQIAQFLSVQLSTVDTSTNIAGVVGNVMQAFRGDPTPAQPVQTAAENSFPSQSSQPPAEPSPVLPVNAPQPPQSSSLPTQPVYPQQPPNDSQDTMSNQPTENLPR